MLYTSDTNLLQYLEVEEKFNLTDIVHRKNFTVQDTLLSYRQIHELDHEGLLEESQEAKGDWRRFSLLELVYLKIVHELKSYGFRYMMLKPLHDSFFYRHVEVKKQDKDKPYRATKRTAEVAVGMALYGHQEIILTGSPQGGFDYFDVINFPLHGLNTKSCVVLNLNELIFEVLDSAKIKHDKDYVSLYDYTVKKVALDRSELEIILKTRNEDTKKIEVQKSNGKITSFVTARTHDAKTMKEIEQVVNGHDFQDIRITRRDGKILRVIADEVTKVD